MEITPTLLPTLIEAVAAAINENAEEITALDQAIGDGDHLTNLQRGIDAVRAQASELAQLDWAGALQKIGMALLTTMGGASGSLFGTLFISLAKGARDRDVNRESFAQVFSDAVEAVKLRGKAEAGEKTMLDVLIPVAEAMRQMARDEPPLVEALASLSSTAVTGMESTRDMVATKGRASFLDERSRGHIDAGARTSQLMICAVTDTLRQAEKNSD